MFKQNVRDTLFAYQMELYKVEIYWSNIVTLKILLKIRLKHLTII